VQAGDAGGVHCSAVMHCRNVVGEYLFTSYKEGHGPYKLLRPPFVVWLGLS
jgi:hypothetical protein